MYILNPYMHVLHTYMYSICQLILVPPRNISFYFPEIDDLFKKMLKFGALETKSNKMKNQRMLFLFIFIISTMVQFGRIDAVEGNETGISISIFGYIDLYILDGMRKILSKRRGDQREVPLAVTK